MQLLFLLFFLGNEEIRLKEYAEEYLVFYDLRYQILHNQTFIKTISIIDFHKGKRILFDSLEINGELFLDNGKRYDKFERDDIFTSVNTCLMKEKKTTNIIRNEHIFCSKRFSHLSACYQLFQAMGEELNWKISRCDIGVSEGRLDLRLLFQD